MEEIMILKCPVCGGFISPETGSRICECEYCNSKIITVEEKDEFTAYDITDSMDSIIDACQQRFDDGAYTEIGKYADILIECDPTDFRGHYYKGISLIHINDGPDKNWAMAITSCKDDHWLEKMHKEIPIAIVNSLYRSNISKNDWNQINIPLLQETRPAFDALPSGRYSSRSLYTQILAYVKKLNEHEISYKGYSILSDVIKETIWVVTLVGPYDYDFISYIFKTSSEILCDIMDKMPCYPYDGWFRSCNISDSINILYHLWMRVKSDWIAIRMIDEHLDEGIQILSKDKIARLDDIHASRIFDKTNDLFTKIRDLAFEIDNHNDDKKNKALYDKMESAVGRFVDYYLQI